MDAPFICAYSICLCVTTHKIDDWRFWTLDNFYEFDEFDHFDDFYDFHDFDDFYNCEDFHNFDEFGLQNF